MGRISKKIDKLEDGKIITYSDFNVSRDEFEVLAKSLSRLCQQGVIQRYSKGLYYKPKKTMFGTLQPSEGQLLEAITRKTNSYLTGNSIYNNLGLTTQIANEYVVASAKTRKAVRIGKVKVRFVKRDDIEKKNIDKLQILDAIRDIKNIPDADVNSACKILIAKIKALKPSERKELARLALKYNPATKALTGAILDTLRVKDLSLRLSKSLNVLSKFKIGISEEILPNKAGWNII